MPESQLYGGVYSPNNPALENLLGSYLQMGKRGVQSLPSGGSIFGQDYGGLRQALQYLMSPQATTEWEKLAAGLDVEGPLRQAMEGYSSLGERAGEFLEPGAMKTDISPYVNLSRQLYQEEFLPQLKEEVSPTYSGFADIGGREAGRRSTELATVAAQLNDPLRQVQGLGALSPMLGQQFAFPMAATSDLLRTGAAFRQLSPQQRSFDIFSSLAGIPVQGWFGIGQSDTSTDKFQKTASGIGDFLGGLGSLVGAQKKG